MNRLPKKFKQRIILGLAFFFTLMLAIATGIYLHLENNRNAIYLAVVGPISQDNPSGIEMVQGSQLYLDRLNAEGGIDGKRVKLLVLDDRNEPELAKQKATEIVKATSSLAVLGHLYSSTSLEGGKVYQQLGMPAISGSATADRVTLDNDWYFRVVFNNSLQASFIANYVQKILNYSNASIIHTKDSYGETLRESFTNTFTGLGGNIKHQWQLDPESSNFERQQQQIIADLLSENTDNPEMIFCATHNDEVLNLIVQMKRKRLNYPLIGADSLGNVSFAQKFQKYGEERTFPGYFSNGIYAVSPIIFDVANEQAQYFRNQYFQKYGSEPSWTAATYYDAAKVAVEAIKRAKVTGNKHNLTQERTQVKEALATINTVDDSIEGVSGNLYFDRNGNLNQSIYVGTFDQTKFISAFTQLQLLESLKTTDNFKEELNSGKIILVDGRYMQRVNIVYAGIDINEIRNLDEKNSSYLVDFYLWFRFQGNIKADDIEFTNYGAARLDSGETLKLNAPIDEKIVDNFTYRVYRIKADFQEKFRFDDYPFDRQQLAVRFRHNNLTRDNLIYVVDLVGMRDTVAQQIVSNWQESKVFDTISDWELKEVNFFSDTLKNDSTLGNSKLFNSDDNLEYSHFNAVINIKRDRISFAIKNLLPLLFLIGVSYLLLFLPFEHISVEAVSGILLAIVFFHLSLLEALPDGIGYVVALDYGFYIIYSLIGLELLLVVIGNKPEINKNKSAIRRLLLSGRIIFPTILLISTFVFLAKYRI
jgi:branched-chain amino acid transport system substrate-binding protein